MKTETEARMSWCPMVRALFVPEYRGAGAVAVNTAQFPSRDTTTCRGSNCMMWRWAVAEYFDDGVIRRRPTDRGFCGLAGKPELV